MDPKTLMTLALATAMAASPALAAKKAAPAQKATPAQKAPETTKEVELVYDLPMEQAGQLQKLVDSFNEKEPGAKLVLSQRDWSQGKMPTLLFLSGKSGTHFLAGPPRYKPLWQVMRDAKSPLAAGKPPGQMSPAALDRTGKLLGLPALGTPVMVYNKAAFKKAGLNPEQPPGTWADLQQALGDLRDKGYACPYATSEPRWVHVENTDAWHDNAFASGGTQESALAINDLLMIKHLALMTSWYKSRYLHIFGRGDEADGHFGNGECAVLTTTSSAVPGLQRRASFELGVAPLPYHDDIRGAPRNTLADGAVLWVAAGQTPVEYGRAAHFVRFLLSQDGQTRWQKDMGYLPLGKDGLPVMSPAAAVEGAVQNRVALGQLTAKPVTAASRATRLAQRQDIRDIVDVQLEELWADKKPAKEAVDVAVKQANLLLSKKH